MADDPHRHDPSETTIPPEWDPEAMFFRHALSCQRCRNALRRRWQRWLPKRRRMRKGDPGE
jgi:hypothetical protein